MGAADDIKKGLAKTLGTFAKQRKAEEKHASASRWRRSRMMEVRGKYFTEAAAEVLAECYMKASDNNQLPATARQIYYVARPLIEQLTDKQLEYGYFSQKVLPDYVKNHPTVVADWDVVYDDRGHFIEPHSGRVVGLGTLAVRAYLKRVRPLQLEDAGFDPAAVTTCGPDGSFGAVLYVEKEGFLPLFRRVKLAKRYDIAICSCKGTSVTAARKLAERLCSSKKVPLLVLHDFDASGIIIRDTIANDTRRFSYDTPPHVIDLGLLYDDIDGLPSEPYTSSVGEKRLAQAGISQDAIDFLSDKRVELNMLTARQLVDFVEDKLDRHGIKKLIPPSKTLAQTFQMFAASERLSEAFDELKDSLSDEPVDVPANLEAKVKAKLKKDPSIPWHHAVHMIVDPEWTPDDDDDADDDGELDDE